MLGKRLRLVHARSGDEAIDELRRGLDVDAVLTDVVMPNGTGPELFDWVHEYRPELRERIIFMIGMAPPKTLERLSAQPRLQKPFSMEEVYQALSNLLGVEAEAATPRSPPDRSRLRL